MLLYACRNLVRRPLRNGLTVAGVALAVAVLVCLLGYDRGYQRALGQELERMGLQLMLVPLGCPYDAAARVLKGQPLENTLPESALRETRRDPAVAVAAPLFMAALPRPSEGRADMWVGLDREAVALKPWWHARAGADWFSGEDSVILGCDAAEVEMRSPGDLFLSPETNQKLRVAGVLERSATADDSLFFVPLQTAQRMFGQPGRLTAIAIRLRDPMLLGQAAERLQRIPGAQVVTMAEMMGVFLNLVGAAHTLMLSIAVVALVISALGIFNLLLAGVVERANELSVLRAIGASRVQVMGLIATEALLLAGGGSVGGMLLAAAAGPRVEAAARHWLPLAPNEQLLAPSLGMLLQCVGLAAAAGVLGGVYPAWRASRRHPASALKEEMIR